MSKTGKLVLIFIGWVLAMLTANALLVVVAAVTYIVVLLVPDDPAHRDARRRNPVADYQARRRWR